jgi:hypothetical protein
MGSEFSSPATIGANDDGGAGVTTCHCHYHYRRQYQPTIAYGVPICARRKRKRTRSRKRAPQPQRQRPSQWYFTWDDENGVTHEFTLSPRIVACLEDTHGWRIERVLGSGAFTVAFEVVGTTEGAHRGERAAVLLRGNNEECTPAAELESNERMEEVQQAQREGVLDTIYMMEIQALVICDARITEDARFCDGDALEETYLFVVELVGETAHSRLTRIAEEAAAHAITTEALLMLAEDGVWPADDRVAGAIRELCAQLRAMHRAYEEIVDYLVSVNWWHEDLHARNLAYRRSTGRLVLIDLDSMDQFASAAEDPDEHALVEEEMRGLMYSHIVEILRIAKPSVFAIFAMTNPPSWDILHMPNARAIQRLRALLERCDE